MFPGNKCHQYIRPKYHTACAVWINFKKWNSGTFQKPNFTAIFQSDLFKAIKRSFWSTCNVIISAIRHMRFDLIPEGLIQRHPTYKLQHFLLFTTNSIVELSIQWLPSVTQQQWKYLWAGSNQSPRPSIESMGKYVHTLNNKRVGNILREKYLLKGTEYLYVGLWQIY